MIEALKSIAARLPKRWQQELKRLVQGLRIRSGRFRTDEPEYLYLGRLVKPGDWVIDVGANVGIYTARLSELVGAEGRVIALEPVPETFELLAANVARMQAGNVTLINAAASDAAEVMGMKIPRLPSGLDNYYMARLSRDESDLRVLCITIDTLVLGGKVSLVKIDSEGHDFAVLKGMQALLRRDRPVLIVEDTSEELGAFLGEFGYSSQRLPGSHSPIYSTAPLG